MQPVDLGEEEKKGGTVSQMYKLTGWLMWIFSRSFSQRLIWKYFKGSEQQKNKVNMSTAVDVAFYYWNCSD